MFNIYVTNYINSSCDMNAIDLIFYSSRATFLT